MAHTRSADGDASPKEGSGQDLGVARVDRAVLSLVSFLGVGVKKGTKNRDGTQLV